MRFLILLLMAASVFCMTRSFAEPSRQGEDGIRHERRSLEEQYAGIVANQTVTVAGHDFYRYFVASWRDRELSERYAISIHERPSARSGTQVWIEYAQRRVFHAALPAGRASIRLLSEQAVEMALQKVAEIEVERLLFREADIGADEI